MYHKYIQLGAESGFKHKREIRVEKGRLEELRIEKTIIYCSSTRELRGEGTHPIKIGNYEISKRMIMFGVKMNRIGIRLRISV